MGVDVPDRADTFGLSWVYMAPKNGRSGIIQKTGDGGGFITYMAVIPQQSVGAFVVVMCSLLTCFTDMSGGISELAAELSGYRPQVIPAS